MNPVRKAWCRTYQTVFRLALPVLPYTEPKILPSTDAAADMLAERGVRSVLLVTDPGIARLHLTDGLEHALLSHGISCAVFSDTVANPTVRNVEDAAELYRENGCEAIIGFGGGSAMDCAKAVGARIARPNKPLAKMRGVLRVLHRIPLLVAVPTTAGTGSEVTLAAVITDGESHYKYPINDFVLIPRYAVHDYRVTLGLPAAITGQTGMDALTHAVEAYIGRSTTTYTRANARDAVCLIHDNLLRAYRDGSDAEARQAMLTAAYKAGVAFTRSYVGYVHGIAHSLGGQYGTPHGLANAVILPHVLRAYGSSCTSKLAELARVTSVASADVTDAEAADAFIRWIDEMNEQLGIPRHLEGIRRADVPAMAAHADAESNPLYPVPRLMDAGELAELYEVVAGGRFADDVNVSGPANGSAGEKGARARDLAGARAPKASRRRGAGSRGEKRAGATGTTRTTVAAGRTATTPKETR